MINLNKDSNVYILCPANVATGGPELLHQLAHTLDKLKINSFMVYLPEVDNPVHENYLFYNTKKTSFIEDNINNVLIVPEIWIDLVSQQDYKNIRICIWWLSLDNALRIHGKISKPKYRLLSNFFGEKKITNYLIKRKLKKLKINQYKLHLSQSLYAQDFLSRANVKSEYLSDYLNPNFINSNSDIDITKKEDIILYNPAKGIKFTKKIMKSAPDLMWIPIENMTPQEVSKLLQRSKVYIDFGTHPGKDRIPREAAISFCCIITNRKGSANYKDIDIFEQYKIEDEDKNIPLIIDKIKECLNSYETKIHDFEEYRGYIKNEETLFIKNIKEIFQTK